MADGKRNADLNVQDRPGVYDMPPGPIPQEVTGIAGTPAATHIDTAVVTPIDRIRWGSIFAGLFAAISSLVVLNVLGLALGLGNYDPMAPLSNFGLGVGIWGAISTLIAFIIGGWLAARTAAASGRNNGILNGIMVWVVTIPLLLYMFGSGISALLNTAGNLAASSAQAVAPVTGQDAQEAAGAVQGAGQALQQQVTPQDIANAAETVSTAAWWTLLALLLGLGASALGGYLGARPILSPAYPTSS